MRERRDLDFVQLVQKKYDEASQTEGCVVQQAQRGKRIQQVCLIDPETDMRHAIQRQKRSHILETTASKPIRTPLTDSVSVEVNPQRLLVDRDGDVRLLSKRETLYMSGNCLGDTRESLERSQPFPIGSIATISDANSIGAYDESLVDLLSSKRGTLQERAQSLLRSGFISRRYCKIDWVDVDDEQFPDLPNGFRVVRANFTTDDMGVSGTLSNVIETEPRTLSTDSIEVGFQFSTQRFLSTLDGDVFGDDFDVRIEGNEAHIAASTPSGFASLATESLVQIIEIIDYARLVPIRSK